MQELTLNFPMMSSSPPAVAFTCSQRPW